MLACAVYLASAQVAVNKPERADEIDRYVATLRLREQPKEVRHGAAALGLAIR